MLRRANKIITINHNLASRRFAATSPAVSTAVVVPSLQQQQQYGGGRRSFAAAAAAATSREKRALTEQQVKGTGGGTTTTAKGSTPPPPATTSPAPSGGGGGGGGGSMVPMLAVLAAAGGGAAYYFDMFGGSSSSSGDESKQQKEEEKPHKKEPVTIVEADVVETTKDDGTVQEEVVVTEETIAAGELKDAAAVVVSAEQEAEVVKQAAPVVVQEPKTETPAPVTTTTAAVASETAPSSSSLDESKIMETLNELKAQLNAKTDKALTEAHRELAKLSTLDMDDLESMTPTQLKVRLVQMAKDMDEQAKWEAVRLQEFLALKEREVEDKYLLVIKKLRRESEDLMDEKLSKQKKELQAQLEAALKEQQASSDAFLESSLKIQEQQYEEEKAAYEQKVEESMSAKYEELFGKSMAEAKQAMNAKMDQKVKQMETLSKKLADLELALQSTKDFHAGSVQAHRITAAAIALSEKLDSGEPASAAVNALKAVASDNVVVSSAAESIPETVSTTGLSTLQELQTLFEEEVYPRCRRASNIPEGQSGLEGQILGTVFSTLKYPPTPDDPAPESEKDASEYVLARARRHVQLGELEDAATEMSKLNGQVAFVAKDWENRVKDRVAVDKAMKVIRMELALA
eukprot:CAMPEP_0113487524 /NCGR_PEP_ID=MMETSP0014_2-20120614/25552_1 /TAXON_ID=2857 /ORGANISM="Nitzschia sp." /LENGTH=631 /DNA_ID=CAMNT_0000381221 /DNA_START=198 /DNA_END=2090 /DNA_ORIENTATION=- /assembly_acc=CAM_ASM_000159